MNPIDFNNQDISIFIDATMQNDVGDNCNRVAVSRNRYDVEKI
jgi:hypothetical protein